ncbi:MAG TPA: histidinol-phosphate transaminase, partial [Ilumatobacteraceae bacterium]
MTSVAAPSPRPHLADVPIYSPGRSAEAAMAEHGIAEAIKLASNEVPFGPLPGVAEAVGRAMNETYRYADHMAVEVAETFAATVGVGPSHVAVGPGSVGLLQQLTLAYAGPTDDVLFPWPSFIAYPQFSGIVVANQVTVPLRRFTIDVDAVLAAVTDRTRIIFIANPNNPPSTAIRTANLRRLVELAPASTLVVIDEAYHEFATGADVPNALSLLDEFPNVVVLRTLSKAYGMAGLRVGFVVGDPRVLASVNATLIPFAVNGPAQAAAIAALGQQDEVRRRCAVISAERDRGAQLLRRAGLGVPASQGNFWWLPAGARSADLAVALERRGVVVRPFPTGIRVTVGAPHENARFMDALAEVRAAEPGITAEWGLPTGELATATADFLDGIGRETRARMPAATAEAEIARAADRLGALVAELAADEWSHVD